MRSKLGGMILVLWFRLEAVKDSLEGYCWNPHCRIVWEFDSALVLPDDVVSVSSVTPQ
jgi:hypothetical protein